MKKLKIQKTDPVLYGILNPIHPLENRKDITSDKKIIVVSLFIVGLSLPNNRKCLYTEEISWL